MQSRHDTSLLFVYGLLRRGCNHPMASYLEQNARFISHGFMHGQLFLVDDYPGAVTMHTSARVYGDVYGNYDEMIFTALDEFEEIDQTDEYIRRSVSIFAQAEEMTCWTYLYNRPTQQLTHITSGDFLKYLDEKSGKKG